MPTTQVPVERLAAMYQAGASVQECATVAGVSRWTVTRLLREAGVSIRPVGGVRRPTQSPETLRTASRKSKLTMRARVASLEAQVRYWKGLAQERAAMLHDPDKLERRVAKWKARAEQAEAELVAWEQRWRDAAYKWRRQMGLTRAA